MPDRKILFIPSRNDNNYLLLNKYIDLVKPVEEKEIELNELSSLNHFSFDEKNDLIRLFKGDYESILTKDFSFSYQNDQWFFTKYGYPHTYTTKILFRMNNDTEYRYNCEVRSSDLRLIASLLDQYNRILEVDLVGEIGEGVEGYEIDQEVLKFISKCLNETTGDSNLMNYSFIKRFVEALQKYDDLLWEKFFSEENTE